LRRRITLIDVGKVGCLAILVAYCVLGVATVLRRAAETRRAGTCVSNMIQVWRGLKTHAVAHKGLVPPAESWCDALVAGKFIRDERLLHCPKAQGAYGYAMNSRFGGAEYETIRDPTQHVFLFESTTDLRNAHDRLQSVPDPPRHPRGNHFIYVDGHGGPLQEVPEEE
jgi:hypothetical protein